MTGLNETGKMYPKGVPFKTHPVKGSSCYINKE